jgi:hypothetical protein
MVFIFLFYTVQKRCRFRLQNRFILRDQLLFPTSIYRLINTSQEKKPTHLAQYVHIVVAG